MSRARVQQLIATAFLVACGGTSDVTSPRTVLRGLHIVKGAGVTDSAAAVLLQALVVEVHDSTGALAPEGTAVRFTAVPRPQSSSTEALIESLASNTFTSFATGTTDADGHAAVIVKLGTVAGPARIAIAVPLYGAVDTARFTITPATATRVSISPADTLVYVGASYSFRGGVLDQYGNTRSDPVTFVASGSGATISGNTLSATATGRYTITATAGTGSGTAAVSVTPKGRLVGQRLLAASNITIADMDGSNSRVLASPSDGGIGIHPVWMPGGAGIVFANLIGGVETLQIVDTNGIARIFFPQGIPNVTHQADATPSYDGQWMFFAAYDSRCSINGYCAYRSRIDGSSPELIGSAATVGSNLRPSPAPDGSRVAVVTGGFGSPTIRVIDAATKAATSLSMAGDYPAWSPDGSQIAFWSPNGSIAVVSPDGSGLRSLTPAGHSYEAPIGWTADGQFVIARAASGPLELVDVHSGSTVPLPWTTTFAGSSIK